MNWEQNQIKRSKIFELFAIFDYFKVFLENINIYSLGTILVTGGCGYIGSHTCISLIENNYKVLIIDSLENSYVETVSKIKEIFLRKGIYLNNSLSFIKGDLKNKQWLDTVFYKYSETKNPITSVIHCAGLKSIESSFENPLEYWDTNLSITL